MYFLLRFSPFLTSTVLFALLLLVNRYPNWLTALVGPVSLSLIYGLSVVVLLLLGATLIFIGAGHPFFSRLRFYPFLFVLWLSGLSIIFFSESAILLWGMYVLLPLCTWIWLESLFLFWQRPISYQAYTLEKLSSYLYLLAIALYTSAAIGLQTFMQIPFWMIILLSSFVFFLVQYDLYALNKISSKHRLTFSAFGTILGIQLLVVLNLLPTHFFLYGLSIMLFYYIYTELVLQLLKKKKRGELSMTVSVVIASLGAIVLFFSTYFIQ